MNCTVDGFLIQRNNLLLNCLYLRILEIEKSQRFNQFKNFVNNSLYVAIWHIYVFKVAILNT